MSQQILFALHPMFIPSFVFCLWGIALKIPPNNFFLQENPITGRKADVVKAAHLCAEAALRLVKPGNQVNITNTPKYF